VRRVPPLALGAIAAAALIGVGFAAEHVAPLFALKFSIQRNAELMPSSLVVPGPERRRGLPTLSLFLADADLYDPKTGILANKDEHGRAWERRGTVSYLDGGDVLYASTAGVRVHGGGSRITSPRQGFRLYFRREYGASMVPPGLLFDTPHAHPLHVLIVHNDVRNRPGGRWALVNPLAFDIATAAGAIATPARPVRFLLNGELQGVYVLYEHFTPEHYFTTHGRHVKLEAGEFRDLWDQVHALSPLTMASVSEIVDLENLTRWFIATAFCATRDPFQGPGQFRDTSRPGGQWFWVNWDMDGSFGSVDADPFHDLLLPPGLVHRGRREDEVRPFILTTLFRDDPKYRESFERAWVDAMNYRLTPAYLQERFDHYRDVAVTYGVKPLDYLPLLEQFLRERPAVLRRMVERYLRTPTVSLRITTSRPVVVDGHAFNARFDGYYFPGMRITLDVPPADQKKFSYWRVNGVPYERRQTAVTLTADQDLTVQAIWR